MAEQILSLTEKLRPKDIGTLAGSIKSPNFKYSVLGTIFGRKTSRKDWMQLVAGIKNPTQQNSLLGLIFGNRNQKTSTQIGTGQTTKLKPLESQIENQQGLLQQASDEMATNKVGTPEYDAAKKRYAEMALNEKLTTLLKSKIKPKLLKLTSLF